MSVVVVSLVVMTLQQDSSGGGGGRVIFQTVELSFFSSVEQPSLWLRWRRRTKSHFLTRLPDELFYPNVISMITPLSVASFKKLDALAQSAFLTKWEQDFFVV